ncbi:hypothetical protein [Nocardia crassostreae]|uniref:hypothetical protein n=1 Tax=Nocardia crassostreae TaxID=53428 RepID=UPI00082D352E|nr:hypothetical protein [Nocardia crassostreae]
MRLAKALDPTECWIAAERYLGGGTRGYSRFAGVSEVSAEYDPQGDSELFRVRSVCVPASLGRMLRSGIASELPELYLDGDRLVLPVHPDTTTLPGLVGREELLACAPGPTFDVVPLANARTVFVRAIDGVPVRPHQLKLHYPRRISRFTRRMRAPRIELELWVAGELAATGAPMLADVCGGIFGSGSDAWGFIVREAPELCADRYTVPLFALYGTDIHAPDDPTLLEQLVDISGEPAQDFIIDRIIVPMIDLWVRAALESGCLLEPHGQNTLFRFTADGSQTELRYRDCDVFIDPAVRARRGLNRALPPVNVIGSDVDMPASHLASLVYDSSMGHHALDYLAALAERRWHVDPEALRKAARSAFHTAIGTDPYVLLPATTYYYDDHAAPGTWALVDTGNPPRWR